MAGKFINEVDYVNFAGAVPTPYGVFGFGYIDSELSFTSPTATLESVERRVPDRPFFDRRLRAIRTRTARCASPWPRRWTRIRSAYSKRCRPGRR